MQDFYLIQQTVHIGEESNQIFIYNAIEDCEGLHLNYRAQVSEIRN